MSSKKCPDCGRSHRVNSRSLVRCQIEAEWQLNHLIVRGDFDKPELSLKAQEAKARAERFKAYIANL